METSPGSRLENVLARFAEQHGILTRAQEQMRALSVTARSRDGVVEVTVGADGRASGVRFVDRRYREMAAPQVADSVQEALRTAGGEAAARVTAVWMSASFRPLVSAEPVPWDEPVAPETRREVQDVRETPSVCWHCLVREARAVAADPVRAGVSGAVTTATGGAWASGVQEAGPGVRDATRPRPQEPLWGLSRLGTRSASSRTALPAELRAAVLALRDAVCGPCLPGACGCPGVLERPGRGSAAQSP